MKNEFNGESLIGTVKRLADEGKLLQYTTGENVQFTDEGFTVLLALLAVSSLTAKHPINQQARILGETIGQEMANWNARKN